ncbi:hypothetical protein C8J56DRAFT_971987 [Mycena floridula]|nr:hypothetical protein C8J56DRAFT_971987 [Mycena floridula]
MSLPAYPSNAARSSLSATATLEINRKIASALRQTIGLSPGQVNSPASHQFISSYAKSSAVQTLQSLIWEQPMNMSRDERLIRKRALILAQKIASGLELQSLVDLAIVYAKTEIQQIQAIFQEASSSEPLLFSAVKTDLIPAFTLLLAPTDSAGLYSLRKTCHCICSFLQAASRPLAREFARTPSFVAALAKAYESGLTAVAQTYGGLAALQRPESREDEWVRIWMECKVDLVDAFHVIVTALLNGLSQASGRELEEESEIAFGVIFSLLEASSTPSSSDPLPPTPFLNQPLVADYQQSYDLSQSLALALSHAPEKDVRVDLLQSTLSNFDNSKDPGALKLLILSSGAPRPAINKGKAKASASVPVVDPDLELKVVQVLDVLPDHPAEYIRALLSASSYPFAENPEKVVEALLEGTAPSAEKLAAAKPAVVQRKEGDEFMEYVKGRQNVFDEQKMDPTQLRVGKKKEEQGADAEKRAFIDEMKADLLRRAEEIFDADDDEDGLADDDTDTESVIIIMGDGEDSGEDELTAAEPPPPSAETILELAYIRDPKLFDRDANTRRSKQRADLKEQTKWSDEQIEGWKIMLERNPHKDKILQKHEFSGNQPGLAVPGPSERGGSGRGRGRGRGGRGGGTGQDRAWKDKNKASRGNHSRKRGHDKKMARVAGPPA